MADEEKTVQVPLPPAPKSKAVNYVAIAIVVAGGLVEMVHHVAGLMPEAAWVGHALIGAGFLVKYALPMLRAVQGWLNGGEIEAKALAKLPSVDDQKVKEKIGRP